MRRSSTAHPARGRHAAVAVRRRRGRRRTGAAGADGLQPRRPRTSGPLGAGQLAKTCNNLLHWVHCVANFETLLIAKRYGVDAQRMREVLLECPGDNGTLRRWDTTRFTWQEKDMDLTLELAQNGRAGAAAGRPGRSDHQDVSAADVRRCCTGPNATTSAGGSHRWPPPTAGYRPRPAISSRPA